MPLHVLIANHAVKSYKNKPQRNSIGMWCTGVNLQEGGEGLYRSSSLSYYAIETLNQCRQVIWEISLMSGVTFFNLRFHCCKCNNVLSFSKQHGTYFASASVLKFSHVNHILLKTTIGSSISKKSAYQTQTKQYNDQSHFSVCRALVCSRQNIHFN